MASLTTVYVISMFITSVVGIASAFVGNKIYPLSGGTRVDNSSSNIPFLPETQMPVPSASPENNPSQSL
jgi:hypothetical protein